VNINQKLIIIYVKRLGGEIRGRSIMHIADGILTGKWIAITYAITILFIAIGVREIKKKSQENPEYIPKLALMGAAVFVISIWHIPVPVTGSSSHPIGTPLAAILVGGFPTVVISTIGLFFHMFLAHGGLTTLGANTINMGIIGTFSGLFIYLALRKIGLSFWISAGLAGFVGDMLTYVGTAFTLALSLGTDGNVMALWKIFMTGFAFTQIPLAIVELVFTAGIIHYIANNKSELLNKSGMGDRIV
jgi:cobalt/nickel transport system permease protein